MKGCGDGKFLFCASAGRSGTNYLSRIFGLVQGVFSVHEPEHQFSKYGELKPHNWALKQKLITDSFVDRKHLKWWQVEDLMNESGADIYVETNPLFCTLWHDVILSESLNRDIKIIILRRNTVEVLKSILDLGWYNTRNGDDWMVSAYSVNSLFPAPWEEVNASPMDIVIGYLINVELYTQKIIHQCNAQGKEVVEICATNLFGNLEAVQSFLSVCDLEIEPKKLKRLLRTRNNKPSARKKHCNVPVDKCTKGLSYYLSSCKKAGLEVPNLYGLGSHINSTFHIAKTN